VFATFRAFLQALAHAGRRKLRAGRPGSSTHTPDETLLLALIAAAKPATTRWSTPICAG
jgi:hypothetical protein